MIDIHVNGSIVGPAGTRSCDFQVVAGECHVGLTQAAIAQLGLKPSQWAPPDVMCDTKEPSDGAVYSAEAHFSGSSIETYVVPSETATVGVAVLRTLGFSVDLEAGSIAPASPPQSVQRGFAPWTLPSGYNRVYAAAADGVVYAFDTGNPEFEWRNTQLAGRAITHLAASDRSVYAALADGAVYAFDAGNLEFKWRNTRLSGRAITHLVVGGRGVYIALADGAVYLLDAGNLDFECSTELLSGRTITELAFAGNKVHIALADGEMCAFESHNLRLAWRTRLPNRQPIAQLTTLGRR